MHHATLRLELSQLALARGEAQALAAAGRQDLGYELLGTPAPQVSPGTYSVRWKGFVEARYTESCVFAVVCSGPVRLYVDGNLIIDAWTEHSATELIGFRSLTAGKKHSLALNYAEKSGSAVVKLQWQSLGSRRA